MGGGGDAQASDGHYLQQVKELFEVSKNNEKMRWMKYIGYDGGERIFMKNKKRLAKLIFVAIHASDHLVYI